MQMIAHCIVMIKHINYKINNVLQFVKVYTIITFH